MLSEVLDQLLVVIGAPVGVLDEVDGLLPEVGGDGVIAQGVVDERGAFEAVGHIGVFT